MWDQDSRIEPTVYQLRQESGPVAVQALRRSERDWPLTLSDCQAALTQRLARLRSDRAGYAEYWRWVALTRTEMARMYRAHRLHCREQRAWDVPALLRLRWRLETVTLRLYCAPWLSNQATASVLSLDAFNHLTA